jgi:hypothetical protein
MLTDAELAGMRTTSATALPDLCAITRPTGEPTLDDVTLILEPGTTETIYSGPCRVRPRESQEEDVQVGDLHETTSPYVATLPATRAHAVAQAPAGFTVVGHPEDVEVDDYLNTDTSSDAANVGRPFQVTTVSRGSYKIDRRIGLRDREQPQGIEVGS